MTTGEKLKQLRLRIGVSQGDLAITLQVKYKDCGITRYNIAHWETNAHLPQWPSAKILVHFFKISLDDLFFENRNPLKSQPVRHQLKVA